VRHWYVLCEPRLGHGQRVELAMTRHADLAFAQATRESMVGDDTMDRSSRVAERNTDAGDQCWSRPVAAVRVGV